MMIKRVIRQVGADLCSGYLLGASVLIFGALQCSLPANRCFLFIRSNWTRIAQNEMALRRRRRRRRSGVLEKWWRHRVFKIFIKINCGTAVISRSSLVLDSDSGSEWNIVFYLISVNCLGPRAEERNVSDRIQYANKILNGEQFQKRV